MSSFGDRLSRVQQQWMRLFGQDDHTPRVASVHIEAMVRRFRRRSRRWLWCAFWEAIAAAVIIGFGAYVFVRADYFSRRVVFSKEEVLKKESEDLRKEVADLQTSVYDLQTANAKLLDEKEFLKTFSSLKGFIDLSLDGRATQSTNVLLAQRADESLAKLTPYFGAEQARQAEPSVVRRLEDLKRRGIDLANANAWNELLAAVKKFVEKNVPEPADIDSLKTAVSPIEPSLVALDKWYKDVEKEIEDVALKIRDLEKKGTLQQAERTRSQIDAKNAELVQLMESRANLLKNLWIPDLTVRVGTVILLVFFTQLVVSLMRYHIALASFYSGRADALQLVNCHRIDSDDFDELQLAQLVNYFTPSLVVDPVQSPVSQLADLAKAVPRS